MTISHNSFPPAQDVQNPVPETRFDARENPFNLAETKTILSLSLGEDIALAHRTANWLRHNARPVIPDGAWSPVGLLVADTDNDRDLYIVFEDSIAIDSAADAAFVRNDRPYVTPTRVKEGYKLRFEYLDTSENTHTARLNLENIAVLRRQAVDPNA